MATKSRWKRWGVVAAGWLCILLGIVGGFLPVIQGWIFIVAGLLLLSGEYAWAHNLVQRARTRFPKVGRAIDRVQADAEKLIEKMFGKRGRAETED